MPKVETAVHFSLKEIQDALVELAKKEAGADTGGSTMMFKYADDQPGGKLFSAIVTFQKTKRA